MTVLVERPAIAAHRWNVWLSSDTVADLPPWARPWRFRGAGHRGRRQSSPAAFPATLRASLPLGFDIGERDDENPFAMLTAAESDKQAAPAVDSSHLYVSQLEIIEKAIVHVCRRNRLMSADAEDFASIARIHLIENDYAVLRKFQGRSSWLTYLVVVITRRFQDYRNSRLGKWRPSADARRLGPIAVLLERLMDRDGLSFDEAYETLRTNFQVTESRQELEAIAARLPCRRPRPTEVPEPPIDPVSPDRPDEPLEQRRAALLAQAWLSASAAARAELPAQDRLILRMIFEDGLSIADVARILRLDQPHLYRRRETLLLLLRKKLEAAGLTAAELRDVFHAGGFRS